MVGNVVEFQPRSNPRDLRGAASEQMLDGWRNQQLARNLAFSTIASGERLVRRLVSGLNELPWQWSAAMIDEWPGTRISALRELVRHARQLWSPT